MYRAGRRQVKESARPYDEARRLKSRRQADAEAGEFHGRSRVTFHQYAREWLDRYQGNGRRGFREHTREEYRRLLECFALRFSRAAATGRSDPAARGAVRRLAV